MDGKLIVFEGIDKSGKKTQATLLSKYLNKKGINTIYTEEPNPKNEIGILIKKWLGKKIEIKSGECIALLYTADRYEHLKNIIIPNLEAGNVVICDRYFYSTIAYESALFGVDEKWIREMNRFVIKPDVVILIDIKPEISLKRKRSRPNDRFEKLEKLNKVRKYYLDLAKKENFFIVDGDRSKKEVFEDVKRIVEKVLRI